jgi:hypothetical protein
VKITFSFALENKMSMSDRDGWIWMDGQFVAWRDAQIHVLTHTLHYGMGVYWQRHLSLGRAHPAFSELGQNFPDEGGL